MLTSYQDDALESSGFGARAANSQGSSEYPVYGPISRPPTISGVALPRPCFLEKEPGECRGLVIWPRGSDPANPRERTVNLVNQYKAQGIDTISYYGPEYKFGPEHSPA
jgi:hypothetical protein